MNRRFWDGKTVHVMMPDDGRYDRRKLEISLTTETAGVLANYLRLPQVQPLSPSMRELLEALDYVLIADPASREAHRRMEAFKGMTPDGGYRVPEPRPLRDFETRRKIPHPFTQSDVRPTPGHCTAASETVSNSICWAGPEEHETTDPNLRALRSGEPEAPGFPVTGRDIDHG